MSHEARQAQAPAITDVRLRTKEGTDDRLREALTDDPWMSVQTGALYLDIHPETIRRAVAGGRLRAARVGRLYRMRRSWLDQWVEGLA